MGTVVWRSISNLHPKPSTPASTYDGKFGGSGCTEASAGDAPLLFLDFVSLRPGPHEQQEVLK